jgi:hypothetical protein
MEAYFLAESQWEWAFAGKKVCQAKRSFQKKRGGKKVTN